MKIVCYSIAGLLGLYSASSLAVDTKKPEKTDDTVQLETMEVIAVTPIQGSGGVAIDKLPTPIQTINKKQLQQAQSLNIADHLNNYLGSVNVNDAQNNPYQPDVQYRGFAASPLTGLPQGLSVYVNGVRSNEAFGDNVNWDLIPEGAIETITVQPGSNPVFGLNTLGGALAVQTKTGFSAPKHELEIVGGSWGRHSEELRSGWNNGTFGYFIDTKYFNEDGWRDFSNSEVQQALGTFSWRGERSDVDLTLTSAANQLRGNGTLPVELLQVDRSAVFTHPDITRNQLFSATLNGSTDFTDDIKLSGNMYYRRNRSSSYNGDGSEVGGCGGGDDDDDAVAGGDDDDDDAGAGDHITPLCNEEQEQLYDINQQPIAFDDDVSGGTINTSTATQRSFGFSLQTAFSQAIFGHDNNFLVGWAYDHNSTHFSADTELGALTSTRGVKPSGILLEDSRVRLNTTTETNGGFFSDTFSITEKLHATVGGRYNISDIELMDQNGTALNGVHRFERFNPSAGLTWAFLPEVTVYGNYSESTRMPTPMELSCSDSEAPCKLPNAFVSDPPLKQVVAETFEAGFRGHIDTIPVTKLNWHVGAFQTVSNDDIIFQSTGGVVANRGYFQNVGRTRRQGIELGLNANMFDRLHLGVNYTYLNATLQTSYISNSPSHPSANENGDIVAKQGDRLPGIPEHMVKVALDYDILPSWTLGTNMLYNGDQFLRGDEANLDTPLASYILFNLKTEYRFNEHFALFGKLNNIFNQRYQNFGTYGNTGDVLDSALGIDDADTRFVGVGAPRAGWVGVRITL